MLEKMKLADLAALDGAISNVRLKLVEYQRNLARDRNVVLEGRDIGTVVFPNADYKFYLIANIEVRANRRKKEMELLGENLSIEKIIVYLQDRDNKDSLRKNSPLMKAEDAIELDTTNLTIDEQVSHIISIVNNNQTGA